MNKRLVPRITDAQTFSDYAELVAFERYPDPVDDEGRRVDDWGYEEYARGAFVKGALWAMSSGAKEKWL